MTWYAIHWASRSAVNELCASLIRSGGLQALTEDLFGGGDDGPQEAGSASNPKTKVEFEAFATIIGTKLQDHEV